MHVHRGFLLSTPIAHDATKIGRREPHQATQDET
jgi:hypothetical protein